MSFSCPVKITLKTKVIQDQINESYEFIVFGRYYEKENASYLIYDEILENGTIHTTVKIKDDQVLIIRKGAINMRQTFKKDHLMSGTFETGLGTFILTTNTRRLDFNWDEVQKKGILNINYQLIMEQVDVGTYHLSFTFKEEKE